jgi:hypothetical protein
MPEFAPAWYDSVTFSGDNRLVHLKSEDYPPPEIQDEINSLIDEHLLICVKHLSHLDR